MCCRGGAELENFDVDVTSVASADAMLLEEQEKSVPLGLLLDAN